MRTLKLTLLTALALAFGTSAANAASVDVIWQGSGTALTTVSVSAVVVGDIFLTPTTALDGAGSAIELSSDSVGVTTLAAVQDTSVTGWLALGGATIGDRHSENVVAQGDLFGTNAVAATVHIGTITVNAGAAGGTITVSTSGPGDAIIAGTLDVVSEYSFNAGTVIVPEPTTASLLGLGMIGLAIVGRRR